MADAAAWSVAMQYAALAVAVAAVHTAVHVVVAKAADAGCYWHQWDSLIQDAPGLVHAAHCALVTADGPLTDDLGLAVAEPKTAVVAQ